MDRVKVFPGQIPLETDILSTNKNAMIGVAKIAQALLGSSTFCHGLSCVPTGPASMQVVVNPGQIYSLQNVDDTAYSSLSADTTHQILKQGLQLDAINLNCPAPGTVGQSINYLVQAVFAETDVDSSVLPYYNSSNPASAWNGPGNSGATDTTRRADKATVTVKAGTAATTGSQVTPTPDANNVGLWVVNVAYGQTSITAGSIVQAPSAPFVPGDGAVSFMRNALYSKSVAGNANVTLDAQESNYPIINLTGALTGSINVIVPAASKRWVFENSTSGSYSITVKTASGTGVAIPQGYAVDLMCDGVNVIAITDATAVSNSQHGQCLLTKSGSDLLLLPLNGNKLMINGTSQSIPSAGVALAATSATPDTNYYIYAYMNSGTMTLERSTTGHATDSTTGVEIKSGDATRTLVGFARAITGPAWSDTDAKRFVISWFNRHMISGVASFTTDRSTASTTQTEVNSEIRCEFITWGDEAVIGGFSGTAVNSANNPVVTSISVDGGTGEDGAQNISNLNSTERAGFSLPFFRVLSEGYHYTTILGNVVGSGTATWQGGSAPVRATNRIAVRG